MDLPPAKTFREMPICRLQYTQITYIFSFPSGGRLRPYITIINNNQNITMENGSSFEQPKIIVSETVNESNIMSDNQSEL